MINAAGSEAIYEEKKVFGKGNYARTALLTTVCSNSDKEATVLAAPPPFKLVIKKEIFNLSTPSKKNIFIIIFGALYCSTYLLD